MDLTFGLVPVAQERGRDTRNVRQLTLHGDQVLMRTFALLPRWQHQTLPVAAVRTNEAVRGTRWRGDEADEVGGGMHTKRHTTTRFAKGSGAAGTSKAPFLVMRVDGRRWTYLIDRTGRFPQPSRFDAVFSR